MTEPWGTPIPRTWGNRRIGEGVEARQVQASKDWETKESVVQILQNLTVESRPKRDVHRISMRRSCVPLPESVSAMRQMWISHVSTWISRKPYVLSVGVSVDIALKTNVALSCKVNIIYACMYAYMCLYLSKKFLCVCTRRHVQECL